MRKDTRTLQRRAAALLAAVAIVLSASPPARAWDDQLQRAIQQVYAGTASPQQLMLVRKNNKIVNNMAVTGHLPDHIYQAIQSDFANFNRAVAAKAGGDNGLDLAQQKSKPKPGQAPDGKVYSPGTDSDFIAHSKSGKMTAGQVEGAIHDYNAMMNEHFNTRDVNYAKELNTDFMGDPSQMSKEDFEKIAKLNNDAYKRQAAARYEAKIRDGQSVDVTETVEYQQEMNDFVGKKKGEIEELEAALAKAFKSDPNGALKSTKDLHAELQIRRQQQAKYLERYIDTTQRLAKKYDVVETIPEPSNLASKAADRSVTSKDGLTEQQKALANEKAAVASSALDKQQLTKATGEGVQVKTEAARNIELEAGRIPDHEKLMTSAAEDLASLPPAKRGEIVEQVRLKQGNDVARELVERTRKYDAEMRWQKKMQNIKAVAAKVTLLTAVASVGNDLRAWAKGEKSNWEAAETAIDAVSQGFYSAGKNLAGWKETYDLNAAAYVNERQARIFNIAKDLYSRGVDLAEVKKIVAEMENGSEAGLDGKIRELKAQGTLYDKPPPVQPGAISDRTWAEYGEEVGGNIWDLVAAPVVSSKLLIVGTGKDLLELILLTPDYYKNHKHASDAELVIIEQQNEITRGKLIRRLVELGADRREAETAVALWFEGSPEGVMALRKLRDRLLGGQQVAVAKPEPTPEELAARRAHIVDRLAKLNHTKLTAAFKGMGIDPPLELYDCLCRAAGYGAPGVAQFYHPGPIEGFLSPACDQAGDPCVVSGFGCLRHPLPGDAQIWEGCMASNRLNVARDPDGQPVPDTGVRLDEAIEQALRGRQAAR